MRFLGILCLFAFVGCAAHRAPASLDGNPVAYDSMALGNIKAQAIKREQNKGVCFDITLTMKNVNQQHASPSNWTLAWVDQNNQYHLLSLKQRNPASVPKGGTVTAPYGAYEQWSNSFQTCARNIKPESIKSLVLTPKQIPYKKNKGMEFTWN